MSDLQITLNRIDAVAVHTCSMCELELDENGPSLYFCDDVCQANWHACRAEQLVGYREPTDSPAHIFNQEELFSPEVTPRSPDTLARYIAFRISVDASAVAAGFAQITQAFRAVLEGARPALRELGERLQALGAETAHRPVDVMQQALEARRNRNTGPATRQRAPRRIDARRSR